MLFWVQKWLESERGFGCRPDGYTLHIKREDIDAFLKDMREREMKGMPAGYVPDEYSRPDGQPYLTNIKDRKLMNQIKKSNNGIWGPGGNNYPPPANEDSVEKI